MSSPGISPCLTIRDIFNKNLGCIERENISINGKIHIIIGDSKTPNTGMDNPNPQIPAIEKLSRIRTIEVPNPKDSTTQNPVDNTIEDKLQVLRTDLPATENPTSITDYPEDPSISITNDPPMSRTDDPTVWTTTEEPSISTTEDPTIITTEIPAITITDDPAITTTEDPATTTTEGPAIITTENPGISTTEPVITTTEDPTISTTNEPSIECIGSGITCADSFTSVVNII